MDKKVFDAELKGKFEGGNWKWKLHFDFQSSLWEVVCSRNGAVANLKKLLFSAIGDAITPYVSCQVDKNYVSEGFSGDFSLSTHSGNNATDTELAACQNSVTDALTSFFKSDSAAATAIANSIESTMKAAEAARIALNCTRRRQRFVVNFPELPKRINWVKKVDMQSVLNDFESLLTPNTPPIKFCTIAKRLQKSTHAITQNKFLQNFSADFERAIEFLQEKLNLDDENNRRIWLSPDVDMLALGFAPSRRGNWKITLRICGNTANPKLKKVLEKCNAIAGLKRKHDGLWSCDIGPIKDLATFRRVAWRRYAKLYRQIRKICLEIYSSDAE